MPSRSTTATSPSQWGHTPLASRDGVVPCSDASGEVIAVGPGTRRFEPGDRVCTAFNPAYQSGRMTRAIRKRGLGNLLDGTLREHAVFAETALVAAPRSLDMVQASTLSCAAVTVWNCLFGLGGRALEAGDWVLTQGTGGVSLFAVQVALAAGANVIATTSTEEKAQRLREMGVQHVLNYKADATWGETAKRLTPDEEGVDHVIEVGGEATMPQSLAAIRTEGVISVVGFLGGAKQERTVSFEAMLPTLAIVRGINVGPVSQFEACNAFIDKHGIKPIVDPTVFEFGEAVDALKYLWDQKNYGKVVIRVN
ncbi:alcohol dehydrogenase [Penicillium chermesinum]|uniref:Alcohol dehydrogenase n=1 Tax=Penicillium chermesinum TaxID=63820 RepID=A0A9W9N827_9EURO|nr:alcohol dehydrogenase [Penicillium chermesinum]KAJ5214921.1 alcohol dehydrogenase [Penicillium chermesinum]